VAINKYGDSLASDEGNGAEMWTNPDAPISLIEDLSGRSLNSIAFTWKEGASNGGSPVIDYRIYYD